MALKQNTSFVIDSELVLKARASFRILSSGILTGKSMRFIGNSSRILDSSVANDVWLWLLGDARCFMQIDHEE